MNRLRVYAVFLALAFLGPGGRSFGEERLHVVAKGETVYSIARTYGVNQDELMRVNGITDPQRLVEGKRLKIPDAASVPAAQGGSAPAEYRVIWGDTLYSLARKFGITLQALLNANGLGSGSVLKEGQTLKIPRPEAPAAPLTGPAVNSAPVIADRTTASPPAATVPSIVPADPRPIERRPVDSSVRWPVAAREVTYMTGKLSGVVLTGERSEAVRSLIGGTVVSAGPYRGFGRVAIVQVTGGYLYVYGGCESLSVKEGDQVSPGTELGRLGLDAVSEKPQLFFMVYRSNSPVDPAKAPRA
jgi:murein DD-endopeptidase MepM/ murein hydrolase activator NlpD